jgi:hypothetical protein
MILSLHLMQELLAEFWQSLTDGCNQVLWGFLPLPASPGGRGRNQSPRNSRCTRLTGGLRFAGAARSLEPSTSHKIVSGSPPETARLGPLK